MLLPPATRSRDRISLGAAAGPPNPNAPIGSFGRNGYTLQSADGANAIHLRGNVSVDGRYHSDSYTPITDDTWLIRRLRPTLEGTPASNFDFRIMPDFAQGKTILLDARADARIEPWPVFQFGKFRAPSALSVCSSNGFGRFIETGLAADLLPYRDLGVKATSSLGQGVPGYDLGMFDGAVDGWQYRRQQRSRPELHRQIHLGRPAVRHAICARGLAAAAGIGFGAIVGNRPDERAPISQFALIF
jgi:hypothetical protein